MTSAKKKEFSSHVQSPILEALVAVLIAVVRIELSRTMVVPRKTTKPLSNINVCIAALIANLTATAATCVMSWSSPALPMITRPGSKILVTKEEGALLSSIAALGAFFGPFMTGRCADKYGRKKTLLGGMVLMVITWVIFYFCEILYVLIGTRFLAGVCAGCVYGTLPMYIAEISPINLRGSLGSFLQFFDCIGYLVENIGGSYVSYENLALLSACVPLLGFLLFLWIPESPYFLQNKGKEVDALRALQFFRDNADVSELKVEIEDMKLSAKNMNESHESIWSLFKTRANLKRVYYATALVFFQQTTGINVITFYSKTVFMETGSHVSADASSIILHLVMTLTSLITVTASRVFKLRTMLLFSSVGITISMGVLGGFFYLKEADAEIISSMDWIPLAALATYMGAFTLGWGPLIWCITSVIFPSHLKATACGMCASFMWLMTFVLTYTFQSLNPAIGFTIFACLTFVSGFFVKFHLPETKGKTFQEIKNMIEGDQSSGKTEKRDHCTPL